VIVDKLRKTQCRL